MKEFRSQQAINLMNEWGVAGSPFIFVLDFEFENPLVFPLKDLKEKGVLFEIKDKVLDLSNSVFEEKPKTDLILKSNQIGFEVYKKSFDFVTQNLHFGNSFLTNLTCETPIELNWSLKEVFQNSNAPYKLLLGDNFVCFSPESFIQIDKEGFIASFPMKGTIEAGEENAKQEILENKKEKYEHTTIVDLIRNDISKVATKVWVERFRYIESIKKEDKTELLQVSSEIKGKLPNDWKSHIGDILSDLLPAGSISGAPKTKTLEIIKEAEKLNHQNGKRGYYTGIFGVFNGESLSSGVMIRCIEKRENSYFYKSGGGITSRSVAQEEYNELLSKIYVPLY